MARHKKQVKKLDHDTAVYLAGLIDGEGCLRIGKNKKASSRGDYCYTPEVKLVLVHEPTIKYLADKLDWPYGHTKGNPEKNHQDTYIIRIGNFEGIISFIEQILPYLITKKEAAQTVLAFAISRRDNWEVSPYNKVPYTDYEISLFDKIKQLNRVGRLVETGGYNY